MNSNESKQQKEKKAKKQETEKPGYGNPKLKGPDRPST
ncbi:hypothetical protein J2S21_002042 [Peribacillus cavernae]|nr:hypothetical protein [Peribacillus cavernae]